MGGGFVPLCALFVLLCTLFVLLCTLYTIRAAVHCTHYSLFVLLCALFVLLCTLSVLMCALSVLLCTLSVLLCALSVLLCKGPLALLCCCGWVIRAVGDGGNSPAAPTHALEGLGESPVLGPASPGLDFPLSPTALHMPLLPSPHTERAVHYAEALHCHHYLQWCCGRLAGTCSRSPPPPTPPPQTHTHLTHALTHTLTPTPHALSCTLMHSRTPSYTLTTHSTLHRPPSLSLSRTSQFLPHTSHSFSALPVQALRC
jgi:hypothetical protein